MIIIPSIITAELGDARRKLAQAGDFSRCAQIDFFDGVFVPGLRSLSPRDFTAVDMTVRLIAHILAYKPLEYIEPLKRAGFSKTVFHLETTDRPDQVIELAREVNIKVGLAINPATSGREVEGFLGRVDEFLFLAVDPKRPGIFKPSVIEKIKRWRRTVGEGALLSIDGAVGIENIAAIDASGADVAYAGRAIFGQGDPADNYRQMVEAITSRAGRT